MAERRIELTVCDRCGYESEHTTDFVELIISGHSSKKSDRYDLCKTCASSFLSWFEAEEGNDE